MEIGVDVHVGFVDKLNGTQLHSRTFTLSPLSWFSKQKQQKTILRVWVKISSLYCKPHRPTPNPPALTPSPPPLSTCAGNGSALIGHVD